MLIFTDSWISISAEEERSGQPAFGATLVFGGLGYAADRWLATSPWLTLLGLLVGIALGLFGVFTVARSPKGLS